jgi:alkanesulfonate monooxygenase SsuD/methylene tetrahydromethanopterin reductase-like flavin-dependent oxidoreductase (luciferase family)
MKFAHFSQLFNKVGMETPARYEQMWREVELADELGFDYGFQSVHHFHKLRPTPAVYCTGAAARTKRMRLGPMGYTAGLHDPISILEETLVLDNVTNGRFELGLVFGVYPDYFRVRGANPSIRREWAKETVQLVNAFYRHAGDAPNDNGELFSFQGPIHNYEEVELAIRPVQQPGPPIWLASTQRETMQFLAQEGAHGGYLHLSDRQEMSPRIREFLAWWGEAGHPRTPNIGYLCFVYVDETDELAIEKATPWVIASTREVYENTPRRGGVFTQAEEKVGPRSDEIFRNKTDMDFLLQNNLVFVGSPQTVANRIREAAAEGMFNTIMAEFNIGTVGEEDLMRSINLFGQQVIPALRGFDPTG